MKQRMAVMLGFKGFGSAAITIAGIEMMQRIRKGQFELARLGVQGQAAPAVWIVRDVDKTSRYTCDGRSSPTPQRTMSTRAVSQAKSRLLFALSLSKRPVG